MIKFNFCRSSKNCGSYEHLSHKMRCGSNRSDLPVFLVFSEFFKFTQLDLERQTHSLSLTFVSYSWDFVFEGQVKALHFTPVEIPRTQSW